MPKIKRLSRGEMTPADRERVRAQDRRSSFLRETGRPLMVDPSRAAAHARKLYAKGMSGQQMASQVGLHGNTILDLVRGERTRDGERHPLSPILRETEEKVLRIRYEPPPLRGSSIDTTGATRRLRALTRAGFGSPILGEQLEWTGRRVLQVALPRSSVISRALHDKVARVYDKLAMVDPADLGLSSKGITRARLSAERKLWAPPGCWDPYTIDDPYAEPEWTGYCGTAMGRAIHDRDGIPLCLACKEAPKKIPFSGEKLRQLRLARGMPQKELERLAGLTKGHVHHWESGRYNPRPAVLTVVLSVLDATFDDICESEEA